jgi:cytoskeletal protein CcmA (bactofilin family)
LSEDTLKQLANSETTIGSSSQILNIESNAIFNGSALVKKDLEVAGSIKVNGALTLPGITVSGTSNFNQIQASTLNLSGAATVSGTLTAKNGLSVNGNGNFTGSVTATQISTSSLQINGNLILTHHVVGGGAIPSLSQGLALGSGGTASVSGSDTSGSVTISTGSGPGAGCFATVTFATAFSSTPHVVVTPIGAAAASLSYYVNRSTSSFSVCTASAPIAGQTFGFDYIIFN